MSGIVGIVSLDGAPVDRELLWTMTRYLAPRGPDAQQIWIEGHVGFGHASLRTTPEALGESQPLSLDGRAWITADCRIDARADLIQGLAANGCVADEHAPDTELILRAYATWGEGCVDHLLGDFSFAIWDGRRRALFCARDHFGVKPFFYARVGTVVIVSNDLNCVRLHPAASNDLDEVAIADFLVHGQALDLDRSSFSAIRRLPPAHTMTTSGGGLSVRRYWQIPLEEEIRYRRRGDYVEHFLDLLEVATRDRLRTNRVSVMMSGGLDSPTVAATAQRILGASGAPFELRAHTIVFDRIVADEERRYSQVAAEAIGIPIHHYPFDDYGFPPPEPEPEWYPPEPRSLLDRARAIAVHRAPAAAARVVLRGEGADPLIDPGSAVEKLFTERRYGRLLKEFVWLTWVRRRVPRIGIRSLALHKAGLRAGPAPAVPPFPGWLEPTLERRLDLRGRWRADNDAILPRPGFQLAHAFWSALFEQLNPGSMQLAAEARYPFMDLRVVRYLLRLPPIPWAVEKNVLRIAMKGVLPRQILCRPKAPLAGNPWAALVPPAHTLWWEPYLLQAPELERFVDVECAKATLATVVRDAQATHHHRDIDILRLSLQPVSLSLWLRHTACAKIRAAD